ncbi:signal sequence binding protein [Coprinopsis cinerea AmutBmut pab1-1]|nr:signal sequence binding protein [Coprinopsis cinerea AmutBmut pab1-1]
MAGLTTAFGGRLILWFLVLWISITAAQKPEHAISSFDNPPARVFFFDDTLSVIYHDRISGNLFVSQDEGKSWKKAEGIPERSVSVVIEHPYDTRLAFALTEGTKHYRTEDRGKTWRPFTIPDSPAVVARPLSFHSDPKKWRYVIYQGTKCEGIVCYDVAYYSKDAFSDEPKLMLTDVNRCQFAHSNKDFKHDAHPDLIFCVASDQRTVTGAHNLASQRLYSSTDFFDKDKKVEDLGIGKNARGVVAFAIVSRFGVVALKDLSRSDGEMQLYVTTDAKNWAKGHFPHASSARLRENAYTIVESTTHSLGVDVVLKDRSTIGTLFLSNSNGTYFVESLKDTNRNEQGFVDYERVYGVDGVGLANVVANAQEVEGRNAPKKLRSMITFDDGRRWQPLRAPPRDDEGNRINCDPSDSEKCALHLHSVTTPHNYGRIFSSPAPGLVMGVGTVGPHLGSYEDSDTFLSTDAGLTWKMVTKEAHQYEFGDQGSILVVVNNEDWTSEIKYSLNLGKTWQTYDFGIKIRSRGLITLPDSTSQKFLLLGLTSRQDQEKDMRLGKVVVIYLDFAKTRKNKCTEKDFDKWYARPTGKRECIMGHKQWYKRRKVDADCYVGEKFIDPEGHEENCECTEEDYECDYNFVRNGDKCEPAGPEPVPPGVCTKNDPTEKYMGSSGFRKIPGNTCVGGKKLDQPVEKYCSKARPAEGSVIHTKFQFDSPIVQFAYFPESTTILVRLLDESIWQSSNEGYTWSQLFKNERFVAFYHHKYSNERAYLITRTKKFYYTTDTGRSWNTMTAPNPPNTFDARVLRFSPSDTDFLIWTGNADCERGKTNCHAEAHFSRKNGRGWTLIDKYVRNCAFAEDKDLSADPSDIICESVKEKKGMQVKGARMELVAGSGYYQGRKRVLFENVVGFAKFSEFLVVAGLQPETKSLELQVSLDGTHFASGKFPPSMSPNTHAYTVLESTTNALFIHMTMTTAPPPAPQWGTLLKSNSNGTYFGVSIENVNRNERGYVDFEKMIGLDGIALVNVVQNVDVLAEGGGVRKGGLGMGSGTTTRQVGELKKLQTRITHNDGSTWRPLTPPVVDSLGNKYECEGTQCALHVHGYTARRDPRATYSSPAAVGVMMAVGNVGTHLAPYGDSDTFISRDGGFTWEEVHKDAHMWEYGDSGSIIIIVNDEEPTDHLMFTTDEGLTWKEYRFSEEKVRVMAVTNVPSDRSRRFLLFGTQEGRKGGSVAIHVDFTELTSRQCLLNEQNPANDDFELWSPSEDRVELCLFGRQTLYHRRVRDAQCYIGNQPKVEAKIQRNCTCTRVDFECEFNYIKNDKDECVLVPGTTPLPNDDSVCKKGEEYWYERTPYRLIPYSSCEGGTRLDRGTAHRCPGVKSKSGWFWMVMLVLPFGFTALVGYWYYRRSGMARGTIRLPGGDNRAPGSTFGSGSGVLDTLASVPWFLVGMAGIAMDWLSSKLDEGMSRSRRGYRNVPIDEDAQILRFEDED